jgi:transposase-like protein
MAADNIDSQDIAQALGVSRPTVQLWRQHFLAMRIPGLEKDAPRPGRSRTH